MIVDWSDSTDEVVVPLLHEALQVGKRRVETGRVRVSVTTEAEDRQLREMLSSESVEVERVAVDRELAVGEPVPSVRHGEDGALVVPILEGSAARQLVLREEFWLRATTTVAPFEPAVTLRHQHATVQRLPRNAVLPAADPVGPAGLTNHTSKES